MEATLKTTLEPSPCLIFVAVKGASILSPRRPPFVVLSSRGLYDFGRTPLRYMKAGSRRLSECRLGASILIWKGPNSEPATSNQKHRQHGRRVGTWRQLPAPDV